VFVWEGESGSDLKIEKNIVIKGINDSRCNASLLLNLILGLGSEAENCLCYVKCTQMNAVSMKFHASRLVT
jgi:hypothetical protein